MLYITGGEIQYNKVNSRNVNGGGVSNDNIAVIADTEIHGNTASGDGGGISNSGNLILDNTTMMKNTANGGGGGLFNLGGGQSTVVSTEIVSNTASYYGGGVANNATITMTNVTLSENATVDANSDVGRGGGGLYNSGTSQLTNVTVASNNVVEGDGGGIRNASGNVILKNTLVAENRAVGNSQDISATITSLGNNLVGVKDGSDGLISTDLSGTVSLPLDPKLAVSSEKNHELNNDSLDLNAGKSLGEPTADQLGSVRPDDGGTIAKIGIGAYGQVPPAPIASFIGNPTSGVRPLDVTFTNQSTGVYTSTLWTFGDGTTGTAADPVHRYSTTEVYSVTLTVGDASGFSTVSRTSYITVVDAPIATPTVNRPSTSGH